MSLLQVLRYLDHAGADLRARLAGTPPRDAEDLLACVGAAEAVIGAVRNAERLSNLHWTLVYLRRRPDWEGEGILVDTRGRSGVILVPELGLEFRAHLHMEADLDSAIRLSSPSVDLPSLDVRFRMEAC